MAGAISDGYAVRAAQILGADMAYIGTRFIATHESGAPERYKQILVEAGVDDLIYTPQLNGIHANWLRPSMREVGLDPDRLPPRDPDSRGYGHLPGNVVPWVNLWSAGQSVEQIDRVMSIAEAVGQIENDYRLACAIPAFGASQKQPEVGV